MTKVADITFQNNTFTLTGELDYSNVMSVYHKSLRDLKNLKKDVNYLFDFSQVKDSNSAAVALIIEWIRHAKQHNNQISFKALSENLISIVKAAGLDHIIS